MKTVAIICLQFIVIIGYAQPITELTIPFQKQIRQAINLAKANKYKYVNIAVKQRENLWKSEKENFLVEIINDSTEKITSELDHYTDLYTYNSNTGKIIYPRVNNTDRDFEIIKDSLNYLITYSYTVNNKDTLLLSTKKSCIDKNGRLSKLSYHSYIYPISNTASNYNYIGDSIVMEKEFAIEKGIEKLILEQEIFSKTEQSPIRTIETIIVIAKQYQEGIEFPYYHWSKNKIVTISYYKNKLLTGANFEEYDSYNSVNINASLKFTYK